MTNAEISNLQDRERQRGYLAGLEVARSFVLYDEHAKNQESIEGALRRIDELLEVTIEVSKWLP